MLDNTTIKRILEAGVAAPSPDNSQPWLFDCTTDRIALSVDETRTGLFFDANLSATLMGCGAVIENMVLEAAGNGIRTQLSRPIQGDSDSPVALLSLNREEGVTPDHLAQAIPLRATHRGLYDRQTRVPGETQRLIETALEAVPGTRLHWCSTGPSRQAVMRAAFGADLIRYTHPVIHRDFHAKLRFGRAADAQADGLADDTLGIERVLLPFLRRLSPWPLARVLNFLGMHYFMAWRGCWLPMQTAPEIGILTCEPGVDYFDAGRALERVWLAVNGAKLDFQPLGALPLLLVRLREMGGSGFNKHQISKLKELDRLWRASCGINQVSDEKLVMIFRIGQARHPVTRSRRRKLTDFLRGECMAWLTEK